MNESIKTSFHVCSTDASDSPNPKLNPSPFPKGYPSSSVSCPDEYHQAGNLESLTLPLSQSLHSVNQQVLSTPLPSSCETDTYTPVSSLVFHPYPLAWTHSQPWPNPSLTDAKVMFQNCPSEHVPPISSVAPHYPEDGTKVP